jgi:hypothetical protein
MYIYILWHVDPLLGNDREISSYRIAATDACNNRRTVGNGVLYAVRAIAM